MEKGATAARPCERRRSVRGATRGAAAAVLLFSLALHPAPASAQPSSAPAAGDGEDARDPLFATTLHGGWSGYDGSSRYVHSGLAGVILSWRVFRGGLALVLPAAAAGATDEGGRRQPLVQLGAGVEYDLSYRTERSRHRAWNLALGVMVRLELAFSAQDEPEFLRSILLRVIPGLYVEPRVRLGLDWLWLAGHVELGAASFHDFGGHVDTTWGVRLVTTLWLGLRMVAP